MNSRLHGVRFVFALAALAGASASLQAQYYRGGDGRMLERDLGIYNTGGLSGRDLQSTFRFARNVGFGRAGSGYAFQGDTGIKDYSDFVGGLGSDSLSDFRNRSQGSALAGRGARVADTSSYIQSLTAGTRRPTGYQGTMELPSSSYSKSFEFDTSPDFTGMGGIGSRGTASRSQSRLLTDPLRTAETKSQRTAGLSGGRGLSPLSDAYGSTRLSAPQSPMADLGGDPSARARSSRTDTLSGMTGRGLEDRGAGAIAPLPGAEAMGPRTLDETKRAFEASRRAMRDSDKTRATAATERVETRIDTRVSDPTGDPDRFQTASPTDRSSYEKLIQRLDRFAPIREPQDGDSATRDPTSYGDGRPGSATLTPRVTKPEDRGISGHLDEIRSRLQRGQSLDSSPATDPIPSSIKPVSGLIGGTDWLTRKSPTLTQSGAVLSASERAARDSARSRLDRTVRVPGETGEAQDPTAPRPLPELDPDTLRAIREVGGMVDSYLPVNPRARDPYVEHIRSAQEAMAKGQYFTADDRFASAVASKPNELAGHFGRIHAQIGGAIFRSGANNLRRIIRARPELSAIRFDPELLPAPDRLEEVLRRLETAMAGTDQAARDAALLASYVWYQSEDKAAWARGLDRLEALSNSTDHPDTDPRDGVLARFLREVWSQPPAPEGAGEQAAPKAEQPDSKPGEPHGEEPGVEPENPGK